jgi:hypothetical protein
LIILGPHKFTTQVDQTSSGVKAPSAVTKGPDVNDVPLSVGVASLPQSLPNTGV